MLDDGLRKLEVVYFLFGDLFGVRAHQHVHLVRRTIDLFEQSLQINRSARPGRGNDKFHRKKLTEFEFNHYSGQ
jgi:hypothetical protein